MKIKVGTLVPLYQPEDVATMIARDIAAMPAKVRMPNGDDVLVYERVPATGAAPLFSGQVGSFLAAEALISVLADQIERSNERLLAEIERDRLAMLGAADQAETALRSLCGCRGVVHTCTRIT